jgi:Fe-S cluster assembly protein SufD
MKTPINLDNNNLKNYSLSLIESNWLNNLKKETFARLKTQSIPSKKDEEWRYTNIEPIIKKCVELVAKKSISNLKNSKSFTQKNSDDNIFVYYADGKFCFVDKLPPYIKTLRNSDDLVNFETLLNDDDKKIHSPFTDLNTLLLSDALIVETLKNQKIDSIIHIIICSDIEQNINPRLIIKLRENSSIRIFEHCLSSNSCVINGLTEINCEKNSKLDYFKIIDEQKDGYHLNLSNIKLSKDSTFNLFSWDSGAKISRNNINVDLIEENASVNLNTLFSPSKKLHIDNQLKIKHIGEKCESSLDYRGILKDQSTGVFGGVIYVDQQAENTQSNMTNRNLLLSDHARINTKPVLEIYNEDVQCTHSATSGRLDEEKLFYIQSRGIGESDAMNILIKSFASELVDKIKNSQMKRTFQEYLFKNYNNLEN